MKKEYLLLIILFSLLILLVMFQKKLKGIVQNFKIRNDGKTIGEGFFGASRDGGTRKHQGIDIEVKEGQALKAPFDMNFIRVAQPYKDDNFYKGGLYKSLDGELEMKGFYFEPITNKKSFKQGDIFGFAQSISKKYKNGMTDHIHIELRDEKGKLLNPENYV